MNEKKKKGYTEKGRYHRRWFSSTASTRLSFAPPKLAPVGRQLRVLVKRLDAMLKQGSAGLRVRF
jgi:hypothetical protein